jgi:hypothetical protein
MSGDDALLPAAVARIVEHVFCPPAGREVVIVHDWEKRALADALADALEARGNPVSRFFIPKEMAPSREALAELFQREDVGLMMLASQRMWSSLGLHARLEMRERRPSLRCACEPVFFDAAIPLKNLVRLYAADPEETRAFLAEVQARLPDHAPVRITAPAGTDLRFVARAWQIWGWELMTPPVEASVDGVIVADAGVFFSQVTAPITLHIEAGRLVDLHCADEEDPVFQQYVRWMQDARNDDPANWQLAEVGIGGNPNAQFSDVLMEIEAVQHTCHFCFGDNTMFIGAGGQNATDWHGGTVIVDLPSYGMGTE